MIALHRLTLRCLAFVGICAIMGCSPSYSLELISEDHGAISEEQSLTLLVGNAVGVTPLENDNAIDEDARVELTSTSRRIMEVAGTQDPREFVVWGVAPGVAQVEVIIDGELEGIIDVEVAPREP